MRRRVKGQSMRPFISPLDVCISAPEDPSDINPGDVVVYKSSENGELAVHRVLNINRDRSYMLIKGDNIPNQFREQIPFSDIIEKVKKIQRENTVLDLESIPQRIIAGSLAYLSGYDLTPLLFKKRFIDPVLLGIAASSFFSLLRVPFYKNLSFLRTKNGSKYNVHVLVRKRKAAYAVLEHKKNRGIFIGSYIRYRDRNTVFALKFIKKIVEIAEKEYGSGYDVHITDPEVERLIGAYDADKFIPGHKLFFLPPHG